MFTGTTKTGVGAITIKTVIACSIVFICAVLYAAYRISIGIADSQVAGVIETAAVQGSTSAYAASRAGITGGTVVPVVTVRSRINCAPANSPRTGI